MENKTIVLLAGKGDSTNIIYHHLARLYNIDAVILEEKETKKVFLKRRIKKLGLLTVFGQVLFQLLMVPILNFFYKKQLAQIAIDNGMNDSAIPQEKILEVRSINEGTVAQKLTEMQPDLIVVNGTRIISKKILSSVNCHFINTHAGITPMYRGVHGGYWAMLKNDARNCGVTVHLIDTGVDTGDVVYQSVIKPDKHDSFVTYPLKQLATGLPLLVKAINDSHTGVLKCFKPVGKSSLWYHPTLWGYLYHFFVRGKR